MTKKNGDKPDITSLLREAFVSFRRTPIPTDVSERITEAFFFTSPEDMPAPTEDDATGTFPPESPSAPHRGTRLPPENAPLSRQSERMAVQGNGDLQIRGTEVHYDSSIDINMAYWPGLPSARVLDRIIVEAIGGDWAARSMLWRFVRQIVGAMDVGEQEISAELAEYVIYRMRANSLEVWQSYADHRAESRDGRFQSFVRVLAWRCALDLRGENWSENHTRHDNFIVVMTTLFLKMAKPEERTGLLWRASGRSWQDVAHAAGFPSAERATLAVRRLRAQLREFIYQMQQERDHTERCPGYHCATAWEDIADVINGVHAVQRQNLLALHLDECDACQRLFEKAAHVDDAETLHALEHVVGQLQVKQNDSNDAGLVVRTEDSSTNIPKVTLGSFFPRPVESQRSPDRPAGPVLRATVGKANVAPSADAGPAMLFPGHERGEFECRLVQEQPPTSRPIFHLPTSKPTIQAMIRLQEKTKTHVGLGRIDLRVDWNGDTPNLDVLDARVSEDLWVACTDIRAGKSSELVLPARTGTSDDCPPKLLFLTRLQRGPLHCRYPFAVKAIPIRWRISLPHQLELHSAAVRDRHYEYLEGNDPVYIDWEYSSWTDGAQRLSIMMENGRDYELWMRLQSPIDRTRWLVQDPIIHLSS